VAADADGEFVVAWTAYYPADDAGYGVFAQRYEPIITSTTSTTTTSSTTTTLPPSIPALSSAGGFLLGLLLMLPMAWELRRRVAAAPARSR
jgi:hypothetical protein